MEFFERDGIRFRYRWVENETKKSAPVVAFCHGLGGDSEQTAELVGKLPHHRLLLWDCRGHGQTEPVGPENGFDFRTFADDLAALLDHLDVDTAIVGGVSMGAGVAARFALRHYDRLLGLILSRPAWLDEPLPSNLEVLVMIAALLERFGAEKGLVEFKKTPEFEQIRSISADIAESLCGQFEKPGAVERRVRLERMPNASPINEWEEMKELDVPTLVLGNGRDPIHPLEYARTWANRLRAARFVQIPSKTESVEKHNEEFRKNLIQFLDSLSSRIA